MRIVRACLAAAMLAAVVLGASGCGRGSEGTATEKPSPYQGYRDPRRNIEPSTDRHLNPKP